MFVFDVYKTLNFYKNDEIGNSGITESISVGQGNIFKACVGHTKFRVGNM